MGASSFSASGILPLARAWTLAAILGVLAACDGGIGGGDDAPTPTSMSPNIATCAGSDWVNAWQASPSDATMPVDRFVTPTLAGLSQTFRSVFSPLGSGEVIRVHLSNRFGRQPVTFDTVWIAKRTSGAAIDPDSSVQLFFDGAPGVTISSGSDVVTDEATFPFSSLEDIAVSVFASNPGPVPTQHFQARQWSYVTPPLAGDHSQDAAADTFTQKLSLRPFVVAMDTLAPASTGVVVAFGDSLTDGDRVPATFPVQLEEAADIDDNVRYPDFLRRRLEASGRSVFVSNAGIGANRILADAGPVLAFAGPSAINRLDADVLQQAGVTDVILFEGINDLGSSSQLPAEDLIAGYVQLIDAMHAKGLNVIHGPLTPAGGALIPTYSSTETTSRRQIINEWIRTASPADAVADFDAAVRNPQNHNFIDPQYDGGDGLHFNAAGNERLAAQLDLGSIRGARCASDTPAGATIH